MYQGQLTKWQRFRMFSGGLAVSFVLARALVHADGVVIHLFMCEPGYWSWWVDTFGEYAGYMRWLYCAVYGLP